MKFIFELQTDVKSSVEEIESVANHYFRTDTIDGMDIVVDDGNVFHLEVLDTSRPEGEEQPLKPMQWRVVAVDGIEL